MMDVRETTKFHQYRSVDTIRFLFSVIIVYFHLFSNIPVSFRANELYQELGHRSEAGGLIVECFLIIAGFFIFQSYQRNNDNFCTYTLKRFVRLWPVFAFYTLMMVLLHKLKMEDVILDLSFLHCTGISLSYRGIIWYISPFFWCSILLYGILQAMSKRLALLIIGITAYFCYVININNLSGGVGRHVVYSFLSLGMLRVFGGLAVGIMIGASKEAWQSNSQLLSVKGCSDVKYYRGGYFVLISIIELSCLCLLCYNFIIDKIFANSFTTVVLFSVLFVSFISEGGFVSRLLNNSILSFCGKYSYSIYVMQQVSFLLLGKTLWKDEAFFLNYPKIGIFVSVLFSVFTGIVTYYIVERPCVRLYRRFFVS